MTIIASYCNMCKAEGEAIELCALHAAAPDLLKACHFLIEAFEDAFVGTDLDPQWVQRITQFVIELNRTQVRFNA